MAVDKAWGRCTMDRAKWESRYYLVSFLLSLYLLFSIAVGYMDVSAQFRKINHVITICILVFFVVEIIFLSFITKDKKQFLRDNWISIAAIAVSLPLASLFQVFEQTGVFFAIYLVKAGKVLKFTKLFKVFKTVKLGKKTAKSMKKRSL